MTLILFTYRGSCRRFHIEFYLDEQQLRGKFEISVGWAEQDGVTKRKKKTVKEVFVGRFLWRLFVEIVLKMRFVRL